ncbi:hypothetical protein Taro_048860 [Colocasia esculenta]|uniref:Vacuolar protein sorting-associated protein 62 n=1 Tax=Colocasia esculenta TaxID=4460 RepID=A0A843X9D0_COLES|nr:hypothetical protein [Colocasia esculenta]
MGKAPTSTFLTMGNSPNKGGSGNRPLPVETAFRLPAPLPSWPPGNGFARGSINLGGLEVCQVSSFAKVWTTQEGGPDGLGATFFKPSPVPSGFFVLGCYAQPNNKPLFGWVLVGRDVDGGALQRPVDYTLVWSSVNSRINKDGDGYFWVPTAPQGYRAVGLLVTSSPEKPSPEDIRCVRADLTDVCENDGWVWGDNSGFNVSGLRPVSRGTQAAGVCVGTCTAQGTSSVLWCLKNNAPLAVAMPNTSQIEALMQAYSPEVYFHPDEPYLPCSVGWFFDNGAVLYKKDDPTPAPIDSTGSNLPQGGSDDGAFWLDLPVDDGAKDRVKKGDLTSSEAYVHVKPMLGGTFTDLAVWLFYPFNGPARAKVKFINIPFERIGEHVGDWEHVTLRVSNVTGELWRVFFAEHSSGAWVDASQVEFQQGGNKPVAYSSLHGHAAYAKPGLVLQGDAKLGIGIRNDTARGGSRIDTGARYQLVAADYLGTVPGPPWTDYLREWGPKVSYDIAQEMKKVEKLLPRGLRKQLEKVLSSLPAEVFGEEGPTGPKGKGNWAGDEVSS